MAYTTIDKSTDYFETITYTGNGSSLEVNGLDFQPDWVWIKKRSNAANSMVYDSVRGVKKHLHTNTKDTEVSEADDDIGLNSFDSDGFTVKVNGNTNTNTHTFASWNWKAGTAASGNTSGSGTAKTFSSSSSSTAGFSIVKYIGNGTTNHAIPHGCGAAPTMIIVKTTTKSNQAWPVDNRQVNGVMYLDETSNAGSYGDDNPFTSVAPTSSVFSVGSPGNTNYNDDTYIAYCFANIKGYSKFGSYIGNGNANGPFIYLGFKPAFLMVKLSSGTDDWQILDNKRSPHNIVGGYLRPNASGATTDNDVIDFTSNGFKLRTSAGSWNPNNGTFVYMAFAENPLVTSTGIPGTAR